MRKQTFYLKENERKKINNNNETIMLRNNFPDNFIKKSRVYLQHATALITSQLLYFVGNKEEI